MALIADSLLVAGDRFATEIWLHTGFPRLLIWRLNLGRVMKQIYIIIGLIFSNALIKEGVQ